MHARVGGVVSCLDDAVLIGGKPLPRVGRKRPQNTPEPQSLRSAVNVVRSEAILLSGRRSAEHLSLPEPVGFPHLLGEPTRIAYRPSEKRAFEEISPCLHHRRVQKSA